MKATLIETPKPETNNNLRDFPENVLGVIRKWSHHKNYIDLIVVRKGKTLSSLNHLVNKNDDEDTWWSNIEGYYDTKDMMIEVLPKGSIVEIEV